MQEFIVSVMDRFGYLGICFLITLENLFPPIPSEIILPFGGFMTTYTQMKVWGVIFFSTIGSTVGAVILYKIGGLFTPHRLEKLLDTKICRLLGFKRGDVLHTVEWFEKRGKKAVLFGRCVPIIRSLVSIPAGMAKMELPVFLLYTVVGSTVWNFLLVSLGAFLGASWGKILEWFSAYSQLTAICLRAGLVLLVLWMVKNRIIKRNKEERQG